MPLELDFYFGMRTYLVLLTEERGSLPDFYRTLGRYVLSGTVRDGVAATMWPQAPLRGMAVDKGKSLAVSVSADRPGKDEGRRATLEESSRDGRSRLEGHVTLVVS